MNDEKVRFSKSKSGTPTHFQNDISAIIRTRETNGDNQRDHEDQL